MGGPLCGATQIGDITRRIAGLSAHPKIVGLQLLWEGRSAARLMTPIRDRATIHLCPGFGERGDKSQGLLDGLFLEFPASWVPLDPEAVSSFTAP